MNGENSDIVDDCDATCYSICGSVILTISSIFLLLYIPIILILIREEYRKVFSYHLLLLIGISDMIQLCVHFITALYVTVDKEIPETFNKIIGAIIFSGWCFNLISYIFLTINRLIITVFYKIAPYIVSPRNNRIVVLLTLLICATFFVMKLLPNINYFYKTSTMNWSTPSTDHSLSRVLMVFSNVIVMVYVLIAFASYSWIAIDIALKKNKLPSAQEIIITLQLFLCVAWFCCCFIYWSVVVGRYKRSTLANYFSAFIWMMTNGLNPIFYLTVNRRLRSKVYLMFFCDNKKTQSTLIVVLKPQSSPSQSNNEIPVKRGEQD